MSDSNAQHLRKRKTAGILLALLFVISIVWLSTEVFFLGKKRIGATADVTELTTGVTFKARVDTGAGVSSVHCEQLIIEHEADEPLENRGKQVRFLVTNEQGEQNWINSKIVDYAIVRSIDAANHRYYVRLRLRCAGIEKDTLVTLADRSHLKYKMLLGRDFLESEFVVDVSKHSGLFP